MTWSHRQSPYNVLGVKTDATLMEIKSSHRKLVLKCHPDLVKDESLRSQAQKQFELVQEAYTLLADNQTREKYDTKIRLARLRHEMQQLMELEATRRYGEERAASPNVNLDPSLTPEYESDSSCCTFNYDESPSSRELPRSASSVGRRDAGIPRQQSASSLGSKASAGSGASRSSQVSDGSVDEGKSLFHAIDDLIDDHLGCLVSADKATSRVKGRVMGRLFSWNSKTNLNSALESYKGAVVEFLWAVHYHYHYLSKTHKAEDWGKINGSHEKLVVLYDDLKLAITNIESSATNLNLSKLPDNIYEQHRERHVEFRNRLIAICGIPISVPHICTATRPESGSLNDCDLGHGITGNGPFSSLLTKDKQSKKFAKRRRRWKLWKQGPVA